jgi:hypothetical protein
MTAAAVSSPVDILQEQIDAKRREIHSDQYSISVGEIANLYRDGELDIHPEFQRFYRWSPEQKSRFIESILLGIPIPSLFVAQRPDGKWDVIDGLQRLSTIFHLMGILQYHDGTYVRPLVLTATKYLPALEGCVWSAKQGAQPLSMAQQLLIKRSKLDIKIILRESDEAAKFELFQRLNTGGSPLSNQEIRNAMLLAGNPQFYRWLQEELASHPGFRDCVVLSGRAYDERYDVELVLRFLVLRKLDEHTLQRTGDIGNFLTDSMMDLSPQFEEFREREESAFKNTFDLLGEHVGADAFRRYDSSRDRFTGGFLISAFEAVALGLGFHASDPIPIAREDLLGRIRGLWSNQVFVTSSGMGVRASTRIPKVVELGRELFKP